MIAIIAIVVLTFINTRGAKEGATVQNGFTLLKWATSSNKHSQLALSHPYSRWSFIRQLHAHVAHPSTFACFSSYMRMLLSNTDALQLLYTVLNRSPSQVNTALIHRWLSDSSPLALWSA